MKEFIKSSTKVLVDYFIALLIFVVFIYVYISVAGSKYYNTYLPFYCMFIFLLAAFIVYSDMKKLAVKEKRPQYNLNPYPAKGFLYGLAGFSPIILIEIASAVIVLSDPLAERIKHLSINTLIGPNYFIVRFVGENFLGYALASLLIPAVAFLGYLSGYYGFELKSKKKQQLMQQKETFTKSPWNPTNTANKSAAKKKKKASGAASSANTANRPVKPKTPKVQEAPENR